MTFKELLIKLDACESAREWAKDMPIEEIVSTCHRGDWLLWLAQKVDLDLRLCTLAKGHCINADTRQQAADICRQYIGAALIEKVNQLLTK